MLRRTLGGAIGNILAALLKSTEEFEPEEAQVADGLLTKYLCGDRGSFVGYQA